MIASLSASSSVHGIEKYRSLSRNCFSVRHAVRSHHTVCTHVPPRPRVARGLEAYLRYILQNLLFKRQLRHQRLHLGVLPFQFLQAFCLVELQATEFLPKALISLRGDLRFLAGLSGSLPVPYPHFNLPQQRGNLLRFVFLHRHTSAPSA